MCFCVSEVICMKDVKTGAKRCKTEQFGLMKKTTTTLRLIFGKFILNFYEGYCISN